MEEYLSQKYAEILEAEDIIELFENVKKAFGSTEKAAEKCEIARTTPYAWNRVNYVKTITKTKVLKASLETNLISTLGLLTNKSKNRTGDILLAYLSAIFQEAMVEDQSNFENTLDRFLSVRQEYYGLINDALRDEVNLMYKTISEKALRLDINLPQNSIATIDTDRIIEMIPYVISDLAIRKIDPVEITNKYGLPLEIPLVINSALEPIISSTTRINTKATENIWFSIGSEKTARNPNDMFEKIESGVEATLYEAPIPA